MREVDIIPGTVIMHDHDGVHLETNKNNVVLVPQPTANPNDPLNWSRKWKYSIMITQAMYCFICVAPPTSLAPMLPAIVEEFNITSASSASVLIGACILALGYGNFIIVPCSNIFGRRITTLICALLGIAITIWEATAKSYKSFLGARIAIGIPTATNESLMVQVIADTLFVHERGLWSGIYFTVYFLGLFLGPVISGNISQIHGWRSFFWLYTGLQIFNIFQLLIGGPETRWARSQMPTPETIAQLHQGTEDLEMNESDVKDVTSHLEVAAETNGPSVQHVERVHEVYGHGKPGRSQFKLWQPVNQEWKKELSMALLSPWSKFMSPIIVWAGLMTGQSANLFLYWILTESELLTAEPYNFTTAQVGLTNLAFVAGGLVGLLTAGPLSDWVSKWMTKRNNGIREAEFRLLALIPFVCTTVCSVILGGTAYSRHWPWPAIVISAYALTGLAVTSLPTVSIAYATECYNPVSGDIMVVVTVIKNTLAFTMSYWVDPVVAQHGFLVGALVQGSTLFVPMLCSFPLFFWGKNIRRFTKSSSWHNQ